MYRKHRRQPDLLKRPLNKHINNTVYGQIKLTSVNINNENNVVKINLNILCKYCLPLSSKIWRFSLSTP